MKDAATWRFASPLSLLREWRDRADQAPLHEFLVLGFTVDLSFLEQVAISTARGLGARITILGDAGQSLHDPLDVRMAGTSYLHGLVRCEGAFHPKIALLIGETDVWMAVGSGNPTLSGWGANDELWTVVKSSGPVHPVIREAGSWLRRLAACEHVAMAGWTEELLDEVAADVIARPTADISSTIRLLDNLDTAFLPQLPEGPVEELALYAPFTDPTGKAIAALVEHFDPQNTLVALQPRWTSYDGDGLSRALTGRRMELRFLEETYPRHGKLIQWRDDHRIYALVGSPNLSRSALLRPTAGGGNCELAILTPVATDLLPAGTTSALNAVAGKRTIRQVKSSPALVLLGALVSSKGLEVTLHRPQQRPVTIETSVDGSPGSWQAIGTIPAGQTILTMTAPEGAGVRIRARMSLVDGRAVESPTIFAVSPAKCARRDDSGQGPRLKHEYDIEQIFTDPLLAERFSNDLIRIAELLPRRIGTRPYRNTKDGTVIRSAIEDRWTAHLDACVRVYGPDFTTLIYGPTATLLTDSSRLSQWTTTTIVDDEKDHIDPVVDPEPEDQREIPQRPAYRSWAARWVKAVTQPSGGADDSSPALPPVPLRMLVAGLYVKLLAAGVWDYPDNSWRGQLSTLMLTLVPEPCDDPPDESRERLCTLIAVCMSLLRSGTNLTGGTPNDILVASTWAKVKHLVAAANPDVGADLLFRPVQPRARTVSPDALASLIELAGDPDPFAAIKAEISSAGWELTIENGLWEVTGAFRAPTLIAARVATLVGETGRAALVLARTSENWTLIAWRRPHMVLLSVPGYCWRVYHVPSPATPSSRVGSGDLAAAGGLVGKPVNMRTVPPSNVEQLLEHWKFTANGLRDLILRKVSQA